MLEALVQRSLYPAPEVAVPSPPPAPLAEVALTTPTGRVIAWSGGETSPAGAPSLLFLHGNGENLETLRRAGLFTEIARLGGPFLAPDYPGYGRSDGVPSEPALAAAAEAAFAHLRRTTDPARPQVVGGWSLGAAVALGLAAAHPREVAGLVALSPWTTLAEVAGRLFPRPLVRLALRERYDNLVAAAHFPGPVLLAHGGRDPLIPIEHGRRLAGAFHGRVRLLEVPDAGHNDLLAFPEVWREVAGFLHRLTAGSDTPPEAPIPSCG